MLSSEFLCPDGQHSFEPSCSGRVVAEGRMNCRKKVVMLSTTVCTLQSPVRYFLIRLMLRMFVQQMTAEICYACYVWVRVCHKNTILSSFHIFRAMIQSKISGILVLLISSNSFNVLHIKIN
jgi:hypothetical protein